MNEPREPILVAGHLCLDITPALNRSMPGPGSLHEVGESRMSLGGAVGNVGLALRRLGHPVRLVGAIGQDGFAMLIRERLKKAERGSDELLQVCQATPTSYSIVLSPPDTDRSFLHCPGANHQFDPAAVSDATLDGVSLLHFGYPPLMQRVWSDGGIALADLFDRARRRGIITSLDLAMPDAQGVSSGVDWRAFFRRVLPHVDLVLPSIDETRMALGLSPRLSHDESDLADVAEQLLGFGAGVVVLKLGERGLYLRSTGATRNQNQLTPPTPVAKLSSRFASVVEATGALDRGAWRDQWHNRELLARCLRVIPAGTNGAGDCTIAGFLSAYLAGGSPLGAIRWATVVGASSVESPLGADGIETADTLAQRLCDGWRRRDEAGPPGWTNRADIWIGPGDR